MLATLLVIALAQVPGYPPSRERHSRFRFEPDNSDLFSPCVSPQFYVNGTCLNPQFSFATSSGIGMTAECAGTALTGVRGEAITFTRAGSAYCTIGNTTTGLSNSSMVYLGANVPRAMRGGDGTGVIGLLSERAHSNYAKRSQEFDSALVWVPTSAVVAVPTVTADVAVAPDGTTTADRVRFPAVGALGNSLLVQATGRVNAAGNSTGLYIKGVYDGGLPDGGADDGGTIMGSIYTYIATPMSACQVCPYVSGSWTRCFQENKVVTAVGSFSIGLDVLNGCSGAIAAQDVYLWQADFQDNEAIYSPVVTTSATVTSGNDLATAPYTFSGTTWSMSANLVPPNFSNANGNSFVTIHKDANNRLRTNQSTTAGLNNKRAVLASATIGGVAATACTSDNTLDAGTLWVVGSYYDNTNTGCCAGGYCTHASNPGLTPATGAMNVSIGASLNSAGFAIGGVISNVCVDPTACPGYGR